MSGPQVYTEREFNAGAAFAYGFGIAVGIPAIHPVPLWIAACTGVVWAIVLFAGLELFDFFAKRGTYAERAP